ncbi:MAG: YdaU family protein [Gallionella sp.]|nr:YdaU family protein [Gallionella sp.]
MNFYKHHLGDYDGATAHLTWTEDMAYTRLLRAYYRREQGFTDTVEACRLVRAQSKAEKQAVTVILAEFFRQDTDGWHNKRADEEIAAYQAQAATNRRIARQRIVNESSTNRPPATSEKREPNHKPEPLTKNQEPSKPAAADAARPADPVKEEIWKTGKTLLSVNGDTEPAARFLGKLCKEYGQILVLQAVRDCNVAVPVEPKSWLVARCQERRAIAGNRSAAIETRNHAAVEQALKEAEHG